MTVSERNFPRKNVFAFLDNIRERFMKKYSISKINGTIRPYCFIDFGIINNL